jgi:hypothetical protein
LIDDFSSCQDNDDKLKKIFSSKTRVMLNFLTRGKLLQYLKAICKRQMAVKREEDIQDDTDHTYGFSMNSLESLPITSASMNFSTRQNMVF